MATAVLFLLLLLGCGGGGSPTEPLRRPPAPGTASYRVLLYGIKDGRSHAIAGATVTIAGRSGTTNELGQVQIDDLPLGDTTVTFRATGWQTLTNDIKLLEGTNVYSVQLQPGPFG
jgi:hypothetical protein